MKETTSITNDGDTNTMDIPQTGYFPSTGTKLATKSLAHLNMSQPGLHLTPIRSLLLPASRASSASSTSTSSSSIFDRDSSRAETPLTPPLTEGFNQNGSVRSNKIGTPPNYKLSSKEKDAQKTRPAKATPSSTPQTPKCTPRRPTTPYIQEQSTPGTDDGSSSELDSLKHKESPVAEKLKRIKKKRPTIDEISAKLQDLSLDRNYTDSNVTKRGVGVDGNSLDISPLNGGPLYTVTRNTDIPNDNKASIIPPEDMKVNRKVKKAARTAASSFSDKTCPETERQLASVPPSQRSTTPPHSKKSPSKSRTKFTAASPSGTESDGQSNKKVNSKSNNTSNATPDPIPKLESSSRATQTSAYCPVSELGEQLLDADATAPKFPDSRMGDKKKALNLASELSPPSASEELPVIFNNFNVQERIGRELDLKILEVIRRNKWERQLNRSCTLPFVLTHIFFPLLQKPLFSKHPLSKFNQDQGFIYIFKSLKYPGYVKIGKTKQTPEERISDWKTKCKFTCHHIKDENDKRFQYYGIVELLVQAELWNERRKFKCPKCKTKHRLELGKSKNTEHGEWYGITEAHALQVVEKWRNWVVTQRPYRHDGVLRDVWKWKHNQAMELGNGKEVDWIKWCCLSSLERLLYYLHSVHTFLRVVIPAMAAIKEPLAFAFLICLFLWFVEGRATKMIIILCCPILRYTYL